MNYESAWQSGVPFSDFLGTARAHRALWHSVAERTGLFEEAVSRLSRSPGCWRLLGLADDWCGDAINILPVIARLADASPHAEFRIVPRDRFPTLRDRHLTNGSRSIPIVVVLDQAGEPRGTWGPRPAPLQRRFEGELRALPKDERYREIRRWYARDRGATTADEIARLIEGAAASVPGRASGPCEELIRAA
jgi:hypothetical protein